MAISIFQNILNLRQGVYAYFRRNRSRKQLLNICSKTRILTTDLTVNHGHKHFVTPKTYAFHIPCPRLKAKMSRLNKEMKTKV